MSSVKQPKIYKQYEDGFIVRRMTPEDATIVENWWIAECPTARDLSLMLGLYSEEDDGFYIGEYEGEVVSSVVRLPLAEGITYGSCFFVLEKYRSKGFGKRMRDDIAQPLMGNSSLSIDAHDNLLAMNRKRGYVDKFNVTAYTGVPKTCGSRNQLNIKNAQEVDFNDVINYDSKCFVRPDSQIRRAMMEKWIEIPGGSTKMVLDGDGRVVGMGCRRPAEPKGNHIIGPLYADSFDIAYELMNELCTEVEGHNVLISIHEPNTEAKRLVSEFGLSDYLHMIRMHFNGDPQEQKPTVFAVTSIDVCGF